MAVDRKYERDIDVFLAEEFSVPRFSRTGSRGIRNSMRILRG
jgi:hypothetical protein